MTSRLRIVCIYTHYADDINIPAEEEFTHSTGLGLDFLSYLLNIIPRSLIDS